MAIVNRALAVYGNAGAKMHALPDSSGAQVVDIGRLARLVFIGCVLTEIVLVGCDLYFNYFDVLNDRSIRRIWNMAREESVPTWFSSTQACCVGLTALAIAWVLKQTGGAEGRTRAGWIFIGALFIYFGIDDAAEIHERIGSAIGRFVEARPEAMPSLIRSLYENNPTYDWQAFVAPVYAAAFLFSLTFCWIIFGTNGLRRYLVGCAVLYAVSQFGFDWIEGLEDTEMHQERWAEALGIHGYGVTHTFKIAEEALEMVGHNASLGRLPALLRNAGRRAEAAFERSDL